MKAVGIICEYSPFHYGHEYHIQKVKELYPNSPIILILSGNFTQRGLPSILDKWSKTKIAIEYGVDLVVELPFVFATQSADIFAHGAIALLKALKVETLVFGSETNDINTLLNLAKIQCQHPEYETLVKQYLKTGMNYPTALSLALKDLNQTTIQSPNDLLGLSYIKEIIKQDAQINPVTIQRTNDFHDIKSNEKIVSATRIRKAIKEHQAVDAFVPDMTANALKQQIYQLEDYAPLLFYKILSEEENMKRYQTVDEGIEHRIYECLSKSNTIEELIESVKTKRYTYNKISRMFIHILCNFTKEEAKKYNTISYIRILGISQIGMQYLNQIKKEVDIPIITSIHQIKDPMLELEYRTTTIYASILPPSERNQLIHQEYHKKPIMK